MIVVVEEDPYGLKALGRAGKLFYCSSYICPFSDHHLRTYCFNMTHQPLVQTKVIYIKLIPDIKILANDILSATLRKAEPTTLFR